MRKEITTLLASVLSLVGAAGADVALPNSGFEEWQLVKNKQKYTFSFTKGTKPAGWGVGNYTRNPAAPKSAACSPDNKVFHGGKTSLKLISKDQKSLHRASQFNFPVKPNSYYRVSVWLQGDNINKRPNSHRGGIVMQFIPGNAKNYWQDKRYLVKRFPEQGSFDWQQFSSIFPTSSTENRTGIAIGLSKASGTLWIDDMKLEEVTKAEYVALQKAEITSQCKPTVFRQQYGPHNRQIFSLYQPESAKPTPVLVYIHGGGWLGNDGVKNAEQGRQDGLIRTMNKNGITVAVINYRYSPLPNPVLDAARAIQYLRANAAKFNLNKTRFAASGFSAGATTSLWLALHDDLANPKAADPVLRESTRLKGALIRGVQSSIDPVTLRKWGLEKAMSHSMICRSAGFRSNAEMDKNYDSKKDVYQEFSPITHASGDDPLVRVNCGPINAKGDWIHHGRFGYEFKKHADKVGAPCDVTMSKADQKLFPPARDANDMAYLIRILTQN